MNNYVGQIEEHIQCYSIPFQFLQAVSRNNPGFHPKERLLVSALYEFFTRERKHLERDRLSRSSVNTYGEKGIKRPNYNRHLIRGKNRKDHEVYARVSERLVHFTRFTLPLDLVK
jgi:hypothetical protein